MKTKLIIFATGLILIHQQANAQLKRSAETYSGIVLPLSEGTINTNLRGKAVLKDGVVANLVNVLGLSASHSFKKVNETTDGLNMTHASFQQYYLNVKVDNGLVVVHSKEDWVSSINGWIAPLGNLSVSPALNAHDAVTYANKASLVTRRFAENPAELVITNTSSGGNKSYALAYKIRIDGRTSDHKTVMENIFVDANTGRLLKTENLMADADVNGTAHTLYSGSRTFTIDSTDNGFRLRDSTRSIETYDAAGMQPDANGAFPDNKDFVHSSTDWDLFKYFTGSTVQTVSGAIAASVGPGNMLVFNLTKMAPPASPQNMSGDRLVPFSSTSALPLAANGFYISLDAQASYSGSYFNFGNMATFLYDLNDLSLGTHPWNDNNGNTGTYTIGMAPSPATDAHWGMQKVHDFYLNIFNRNSFDGVGSEIRNYVGYGPGGDYTNAAAAPPPYNFMAYGLGDGSTHGAMVSLDIMGHEFTHMVTSYTGQGGLDLQGESGALNESFSDIFGTTIEFYAKGSAANWTIGEDVILTSPGFIRSLANPKLNSNPDTYKGQYWMDPDTAFDNGGVHNNTGVQNKWYYLLVNGGSGTNDKGNAYNVTGIGMGKARKIAYRNLTAYVTPTAKYIDAYNGSLNATLDLFGNDSTSQEFKSVKEAWYAVGIGEKPTTGVKEIAVTESDLKLYPNPATGRVTISSALNETLQAQIVNVVGVPVMNITVTKGLNPVDISGLAKGMYMIRYNTGSKGYVQKLSVL